MKAIFDILLSIILTIGLGSFSADVYQEIKSESLLKVHGGLSSLETFTKKLTASN